MITNRQALKVSCPVCKVLPLRWCKTSTGRSVPAHLPRIRRAERQLKETA